MGRTFTRLEGRANQLGIWWIIFGPGGVLATVYGVIAWFFQPVAHYGWAAVALSVIVISLFTILVMSIFLIAWRAFRPLPGATKSDGGGDRTIAVDELSNEAIQSRLETIESLLDETSKQDSERVSTPELRQIFDGEIDALKKALSAQIHDLHSKLHDDVMDVRTALLEHMKSHADYNIHIATEAKKAGDALQSVERDLVAVLDFTSDSATVRFLELLIRESEKIVTDEPLSNQDESVREKNWQSLESYIQAVRREVLHTQFQVPLNNILVNTHHDADQKVNQTPPDKRPSNLDHIVWRRYFITQMQAH